MTVPEERFRIPEPCERTRRRFRAVPRDRHEHVYDGRVEADITSDARSGVNATPTFFIDCERFDGDWTDVDVFVSAIEERIQSLEQ